MQKMTREYVLKTLREEHLWKEGESDTFSYKLSQEWEFTLQREEKIYEPFKYSLTGRKVGTCETLSKRYVNMESVFLHIMNNLNENANIKDKYKSVDEWLLENE